MLQYHELNFQNIDLKIGIKLQKHRFAYNSWTQCKYSTLSALIHMCVEQNMDDGNLNCVVFFDVQKAFDSINHAWNTTTKNSWPMLHCWYREQQCTVNGQISSPKEIVWNSAGFDLRAVAFYYVKTTSRICPNLQNFAFLLCMQLTRIFMQDCDELVNIINCDLENVHLENATK